MNTAAVVRQYLSPGLVAPSQVREGMINVTSSGFEADAGQSNVQASKGGPGGKHEGLSA